MSLYSLFISAILVCGSLARPQQSPLPLLKASQDAAIISDSRYLSTGGQFGSSIVQEDGVEFKEESDAHGNRKGYYSYFDPNGKQRTLTYTAGPEGFNAFAEYLPIGPGPQFPILPGQIFQSPVSFQLQSNISPNARALPESIQIQYQPIQPTSSPVSGPSSSNSVTVESDENSETEHKSVPQGTYKNLAFPIFGFPPPASATSFKQSSSSIIENSHHQQIESHHQQVEGRSSFSSPTSTNNNGIESNFQKVYPPGKLNLNQTPDGFSYTFNSIV